MKLSVLLIATACLVLSHDARAAGQENGSMMLTVYKTVTATNHASISQSLSREEKISHTNSLQKLASRKKEVELDDAPTVPKEHDIPSKKQGSENKAKFVKSIKKGSQVQSKNDEDVGSSSTLVLSEEATFNSSAVDSSSDNADFTFRPITLAPENTKAIGPKETAPLLSKPTIKLANVKNDRHLSLAAGLIPSLSFINLPLASILIFALLPILQ